MNDSTTSSTAQRGAEVRSPLLEGACGCMAERGYEAASLVILAQAGEVSKNQLLHYYKSKEGLAAAVLSRMLDAWRQELIQPAAIFPAGRARLEFFFSHLAELQSAGWLHDRLLAAFIQSRPVLPAVLQSQLGDTVTELRRFVSGMLKEMPQESRLGMAERPRRLAALLLDFIIGAALLRELGEPFGDAAALQRALRLLAGLQLEL